MIKEVENKIRRIVCYVILAIIAIIIIIKVVICGRLFSTLNPWYFHGKKLAFGYILATLLTIILSILGLLLLLVKSFVKCTCADGVADCCFDCTGLFQCITGSWIVEMCNCGCCFADLLTFIGNFVGWATVIIGLTKGKDFLGKSIDCYGKYNDLILGIENYLEKHPEKMEDYNKWISKYLYTAYCDRKISYLIIILVLELIAQLAYIIALGCCDGCCCCKNKVDNSENEQQENNNDENDCEQPNENSMQPNYNNDQPNNMQQDSSINHQISQNQVNGN